MSRFLYFVGETYNHIPLSRLIVPRPRLGATGTNAIPSKEIRSSNCCCCGQHPRETSKNKPPEDRQQRSSQGGHQVPPLTTTWKCSGAHSATWRRRNHWADWHSTLCGGTNKERLDELRLRSRSDRWSERGRFGRTWRETESRKKNKKSRPARSR